MISQQVGLISPLPRADTPANAEKTLLALNVALTDAMALYAEKAVPSDPSPDPGAAWSAACLAESAAETAVDALTAQIRAIPAPTKAALAVKIRALAWDLGYAQLCGTLEAHRDFEHRAMDQLFAEAEAIIAARDSLR